MTARPAWMTEELLAKVSAMIVRSLGAHKSHARIVAENILTDFGPDIARWGVEQAAKVATARLSQLDAIAEEKRTKMRPAAELEYVTQRKMEAAEIVAAIRAIPTKEG